MKTLVLDDKWQAIVVERIAAVAESLTISLVARVEGLGGRYSKTVSALRAELAALDAKVADRLAAMGLV